MKLHHIGIATADIEKTSDLLKHFGYKPGAIQRDELQMCNICFLEHPSNPLLELCGGANPSPVDKILEKNGVCVYHLCYETEDFEGTIAELRQQGYIPTGSKKTSLIDGRNVIFLWHTDNVLIELLE